MISKTNIVYVNYYSLLFDLISLRSVTSPSETSHVDIKIYL